MALPKTYRFTCKATPVAEHANDHGDLPGRASVLLQAVGGDGVPAGHCITIVTSDFSLFTNGVDYDLRLSAH